MINKQRFASWLGLAIVSSHIVMAIVLFLYLKPHASSTVAAGEIILPLTTAYSITIVSWFIGNKGIISGTEVIGGFLVAISLLVVGFFLVSLPALACLYLEGRIDADTLNKSYAIVESAFGGMFVLIFNFMFKDQNTTTA